jgi:hypothetical protein
MPKNKITVTLEPEVIEALGPLQAELESQAHGVLGKGDVQALHGPVRYSRSSVVQAAILALCARLGVGVDWRHPHGTAMDIATGKSVPIPDGAEIKEEP